MSSCRGRSANETLFKSNSLPRDSLTTVAFDRPQTHSVPLRMFRQPDATADKAERRDDGDTQVRRITRSDTRTEHTHHGPVRSCPRRIRAKKPVAGRTLICESFDTGAALVAFALARSLGGRRSPGHWSSSTQVTWTRATHSPAGRCQNEQAFAKATLPKSSAFLGCCEKSSGRYRFATGEIRRKGGSGNQDPRFREDASTHRSAWRGRCSTGS